MNVQDYLNQIDRIQERDIKAYDASRAALKAVKAELGPKMEAVVNKYSELPVIDQEQVDLTNRINAIDNEVRAALEAGQVVKSDNLKNEKKVSLLKLSQLRIKWAELKLSFFLEMNPLELELHKAYAEALALGGNQLSGFAQSERNQAGRLEFAKIEEKRSLLAGVMNAQGDREQWLQALQNAQV